MRRIIDGRVYDTETAQQVGGDCSPAGLGPRDFQWYEENLFRKRTGEYFLYGEGGPASPYAEPYGQTGRQGGAMIRPLTYDEAREWAESHLEAREYEAEFGTPAEGDAALMARVPMATYEAIRRAASQTGRTIREVIIDMVDAYGDR
ncbi:MAG: hypothetical protein SOV20_08880 [Coriobacteriales bacterium]|nr:hypothetical protein [Coriobacteriales bacterium]